jgi:membrane dipeptidase
LVEDLYERGIRVVGLTWNTRNEFAVGINSGEGGLTETGARAIEFMNNLGAVIDLAHASPSTFWDVVEITKAPVYVSHANAKAVYDHPRNLDDDQLRAIARSGGAVGLVLCSLFLALRPVTLDHVFDHLVYLREVLRDESIVIGADFLDFVTEPSADRSRHAALYVDYDDSARHPAGLETASSMQNLIKAMPEHGFDTEAVARIATGNFLRVFRETEALAAVSAP